MNSDTKLTTDNFISLVSHVVAKHGCKIVDIDLDNNILNLDGPDEALADCARALAEALD